MVSKPGQTKVFATVPPATQEALALRLKEDRWEATHAGEFLMKAWLDLIVDSDNVDSDNYVDNCRPAFLAHPVTGQLLEYAGRRGYAAPGLMTGLMQDEHGGCRRKHVGDRKTESGKPRPETKNREQDLRRWRRVNYA